MSSPRVTPIVAANLRGTIYDFASAGDTLPMHDHDDATDHISVVARGSFFGKGAGWGPEIYGPGSVILEIPSPHEFEAREDNSRLVNIRKGAAKG